MQRVIIILLWNKCSDKNFDILETVILTLTGMSTKNLSNTNLNKVENERIYVALNIINKGNIKLP